MSWKSMAIWMGYTFLVFGAGVLLKSSSLKGLNQQIDESLSSLQAGVVGGTTSSSRGHSVRSNGWNQVNVYYGKAFDDDIGNKKWFAQVDQDKIVMKLAGSNGYFIDLASNDAIDLSNTLALERQGNWKGLCIEPNPEYWYGLAAHRTCDIAGALVGGPHMGLNKPVEVKFRGVFGGIKGKWMKVWIVFRPRAVRTCQRSMINREQKGIVAQT